MFRGVICVLSISLLAACGSRETARTDERTHVQLSADTLPETIWRHLEQQQYGNQWYVLRATGRAHPAREHGPLATTYFNFMAYDAVSNGAVSLPGGALVVHEQLAPDSSLVRIRAMFKSPGYDPEHNDWYFAEYLPDGTVVAAGRNAECAGCHAGAAADYIRSIDLGTGAAASGAQ